MIKGFFWVWNFWFWDFFGQENLASIFLGCLIYVGIFWGIQNNLKIRGSAHVSRPCSSANKVRSNLFLPGWSCLELSFIMSLLKQKMFLGVPSVVRIWLPDEEKLKLAGIMNITKHKHLISSGFFRVISFKPFWNFLWPRKFSMGFFAG